jgi:cyclopropane-fatty-acyl-phospholipid synthase
MNQHTMAITNKVAIRNPGASFEAIQRHYDVSNEFYRLWLDRHMVYSCAFWGKGDTLESAQLRKLDYHIEQAQAAEAKRVLDIGCGWGKLLQHLVNQHRVEHAVGLTLSQAQFQTVNDLHHPQIEVRLESWSDYSPDHSFDSIISIGAFEHFAVLEASREQKVAGYRSFFSRCHQWLKSGGYMSLQTIAYGDIPRGKYYSDPFIANEIFPQSDLPRLADIAEAAEQLFEIVAVRNDRWDYARTMRVWFEQLRSNRSYVVALVGEEMVARYERYLRTFSYSFELGAFLLLRITFRRIDRLRR